MRSALPLFSRLPSSSFPSSSTSLLTHPSPFVGNTLSPPGTQTREASKKAGGSTKNGKDSAGRRLGLKKSGGSAVKTGMIIMRQRGTVFHAGMNTFLGKDHTLHAGTDGRVVFTKTHAKYKRRHAYRTFINVVPVGEDGKDLTEGLAKLEIYRKSQEQYFEDTYNNSKLRENRYKSINAWNTSRIPTTTAN